MRNVTFTTTFWQLNTNFKAGKTSRNLLARASDCFKINGIEWVLLYCLRMRRTVQPPFEGGKPLSNNTYHHHHHYCYFYQCRILYIEITFRHGIQMKMKVKSNLLRTRSTPSVKLSTKCFLSRMRLNMDCMTGSSFSSK